MRVRAVTLISIHDYEGVWARFALSEAVTAAKDPQPPAGAELAFDGFKDGNGFFGAGGLVIVETVDGHLRGGERVLNISLKRRLPK